MVATLIAVISLVISLITFSLQFIAHDQVAYLLSNVTTAFWPNNVYFVVSLSVFNTGNRPVALISATADLVEMKTGQRQEVTDFDCVTSPTSTVRELFATSPGNDSPVNAAVYQYGATIDGGKLITANLVFRRFGDDAPRNETVEGVVCLRLTGTTACLERQKHYPAGTSNSTNVRLTGQKSELCQWLAFTTAVCRR